MKKENGIKIYIEEALLQLLKTKKLNDITVSEIVKKAGVARASFYRNYLDINEVIDNCFMKNIEGIGNDIKEDNLYDSVLNTFKKIKKKKDFFLIMKKQNLLYKPNELIYKRTLNDINKLNVLNNYYQPYFFAGASAYMIQAWIERNFEEDENTMTKIFFESLNGYMKIKNH